MVVDFFPETLAKQPGSGATVPNAQAQVFALSDTGFTTPLEVVEYPSGVPLGTTLTASPDGVYPSFTVLSGETQVVARSGDILTPVTSIMGTLLSLIPDPRSADDGSVPMVQGGEYQAVVLPTTEELQQAVEDARAAAREAESAVDGAFEPKPLEGPADLNDVVEPGEYTLSVLPGSTANVPPGFASVVLIARMSVFTQEGEIWEGTGPTGEKHPIYLVQEIRAVQAVTLPGFEEVANPGARVWSRTGRREEVTDPDSPILWEPWTESASMADVSGGDTITTLDATVTDLNGIVGRGSYVLLGAVDTSRNGPIDTITATASMDVWSVHDEESSALFVQQQLRFSLLYAAGMDTTNPGARVWSRTGAGPANALVWEPWVQSATREDAQQGGGGPEFEIREYPDGARSMLLTGDFPVNPAPGAGTVITSDGFSGSGGIVGRLSDAALGGTPMAWQMTWQGGGTATDAWEVSSGEAKIVNSDGTKIIGFPVTASDVELSAKIVNFSAGAIRLQIRRQGATTGASCYGAQVGSNGAVQLRRDTTAIGGSHTIVAGDTVAVRAVGTTISLHINGVEVESFEDSTYPTGVFAGFYAAGGVFGGQAITIDDVVLTDLGGAS